MRPSGPSLIQVLAERAPLYHGPGQGARIARAHLRAYQPQAETVALPDPLALPLVEAISRDFNDQDLRPVPFADDEHFPDLGRSSSRTLLGT